MKSFIRTFMGLMFLISLLFTAGTSYAADRWVYIGKEEGMEGYYDTRTAHYDPAGNTVTYWFRWMRDGKPAILNYITVDLASREYSMPKYFVYQKYGDPKMFTDTAKYKSPVPPDSRMEDIADKICDQYRIPHMYPGRAHRWIWFYADSEKDLYMANDAYTIDNDGSRIKVWIKEKFLNGGSDVYKCIVDFNNDMVVVEHYKGPRNVPVLPDTPEEAIYNKAKEMVGADSSRPRG